MTIDSHLKASAVVGFLSFPFWFLAFRFARDLQTGRRPSPSIVLETREALLAAALLALLTFGVVCLRGRRWTKRP